MNIENIRLHAKSAGDLNLPVILTAAQVDKLCRLAITGQALRVVHLEGSACGPHGLKTALIKDVTCHRCLKVQLDGR